MRRCHAPRSRSLHLFFSLSYFSLIFLSVFVFVSVSVSVCLSDCLIYLCTWSPSLPVFLSSTPHSGVNRETGLGTEGGWSNDGPEPADGLRLQGVSFTPSGRSRRALSGVDLHVPAGSVVAVLGRAGAGKVTGVTGAWLFCCSLCFCAFSSVCLPLWCFYFSCRRQLPPDGFLA